MRLSLSFGLVVVLLTSTGCGEDKKAPAGPSGVIYEGKHVSEWSDVVDGTDAKARLEAAKVLVRMGKEGQNGNQAIQALWRALEDEDPSMRGWAAVALVYAARGTPFPVGPIVGPKLKEAADSPDEELRAEAKQILDRMQSGPEGQRGGPPGGRGPRGNPPDSEKKPADEGKKPADEGKKPPDQGKG